MFKERRLDPRERLALPLRLLDGSIAVTRDISGGGLFFYFDGLQELGGQVDFEMQMPEISLRFRSSGEIVRVEHEGGRTGVAVRFVDPRLDVMDEASQGVAGCARVVELTCTEQPATAQRARQGSK